MKTIITVALISLFVTSCTMVQTPIQGGLYTDTKAATMVTSNKMGTKVGKACAKGVLGVAFGDSSLKAAAAEGKITTVTNVDQEVTTVLGVYAVYCTVAYGY